jgi:hypothetical protein
MSLYLPIDDTFPYCTNHARAEAHTRETFPKGGAQKIKTLEYLFN